MIPSGPADEFYFDPALYDLSFGARTDDLGFYLKLARRHGGPILEVGAGTGRVTLPLAEAGSEVVALDTSRTMLLQLEKRLAALPSATSARVRVLEADAKTVRLGQTFPLILATFNVVGHFETEDEMSQFLVNARKHLAPSGQLIFDTLAPDEDELLADPNQKFELDPLVHPKSGEALEAYEQISYDPGTHILTATTTYFGTSSGESFSVPLRLRQWFPRELERLTRAAGFQKVTLTKDYGKNRDLKDADMILVSASG